MAHRSQKTTGVFLFLVLVASPLMAQEVGPRVFTAPQVVAGPGLGFDFVTVITLQNTTQFPCMADVLIYSELGQEVGVDLQVNGEDFDNPLMLMVSPFRSMRLRLTTAEGETDLFQGAASIRDGCHGLAMTAGYDIVPEASNGEAPAAGAETPPEIFSFGPESVGKLSFSQIGRAVVDIDPTGALDGLPNNPGLAFVNDLESPIPAAPVDVCLQLFDPDGRPISTERCTPFDGSQMAIDIVQFLPDAQAQANATLEWFFNGPPDERLQVHNLVIDVTNPNQFRGVPVTVFNPACTPNPNALCLLDERFRVEVDFDSGTTQEPGSPAPVDDGSGFFFFPSGNVELLVKVINGCGFNNHFWVFAAATTNVEYTITVTDTVTNQELPYFNPLGFPAPPVTDTQAFATCP